MHKSDLLPASKRSETKFNAYPQYSRIAERVTSLKAFVQRLKREYSSNAYYTNMK